jgi:parallel beta-helix repeat protein
MRRSLPLALLLSGLASVAQATVINVPADFPTIQQGLDAATSGDEVRVAPGTYVENLIFNAAHNGVALVADGGSAVTTIDGNGVGIVVSFSNVSPTTRIEGFTITHGGGGVLGGGMRLDSASPVIERNVIRDNQGNSAGGLYINFSSPTIRNNIIEDNNAPFGSGGGIYVDHTGSNPVIENNVIQRNHCGAYGGGITIWQGAAPLVTGNTILNNEAVRGAGVYVEVNSAPTLRENEIRGNQASGTGGGVSWNYICAGTIENNVIADNRAHSGGGMMLDEQCTPLVQRNVIRDNVSIGGSGGGVYCDHAANPVLFENVIARNQSAAYGGGVTAWEYSTPLLKANTIVANQAVLGGAGLYVTRAARVELTRDIIAFNGPGGVVVDVATAGAVTVGCVDAWDNGSLNYSGIPDPTGSNGNISLDPLFCDLPALNVSIAFTSPCAPANSPSGCDRIGAVDATSCACAQPADVSFQVKPKMLNTRSNGPWVTAYITPQPPLQPSDIDATSLRLNGVPAATDPAPTVHDNSLKVRFSRPAILATVSPPEGTLLLTGEIAGQCIQASTTIEVKSPQMQAPIEGAVLSAGSVADVIWDADPQASSAMLLASADNGVNWSVAVENLPNTGSYGWVVPNLPSSTARVAVASIYEQDETGIVTESEYAVSAAFSIVGPLGVDGGKPAFSMRAPNPVIGPLRLTFSLPTADAADVMVFDIAGRSVVNHHVNGGAGWQSVTLGRLPAGLYVARLTQAGRSVSNRITVVP